MPALEGTPSPHRWNQIRKLPLHPHIRTLDQYEQAVKVGNRDALASLRAIEPTMQLGLGDLRHVHYLMFRRVHPWAGEFRQLGQMATVAGYPAADPHRIARELELALCQYRELLDESLSGHDPVPALSALAFFHVRFERVHPFLDGNGRTGRTILAVQCQRAFGTLPRFADQEGYRNAMRVSGRQDLAPLINYLGSSLNLPRCVGPWCPRFRLAPRFFEGSGAAPTFDEDLAWSRIDS